jgi:hypothetical protein
MGLHQAHVVTLFIGLGFSHGGRLELLVVVYVFVFFLIVVGISRR